MFQQMDRTVNYIKYDIKFGVNRKYTCWVDTARLSFVPANPNDLGCQTEGH